MNSSHQQEKRYTPTCILSVVCIYYGIQNHLHYGFNTNMSTVPSISTTPAHSYKTRTSPAGRPGSWTGPGLSKDRPGQRPSRSTRDPGKTQARPIFFFSNMGFETYQYILYVPTKKVMFFQCEIWNSLVYMLYVHKKKAMFFQCEIWNPLVYMLYIPKKKLSFFNVEFKTH